ncbi:hypothetical protein MMC31_007135 [Peltigera leucophlebia]|nr:hypothetical protein [Peltigera leucophlebia]
MSLSAIKLVLWGQNFAVDQNTRGGREGVEGSGSSFADEEILSGGGKLESELCVTPSRRVRFLRRSLPSCRRMDDQNSRGVGKSGLSSADEENLSGGILEPEPSSCLVQFLRRSLPSRQKTNDQRFRGVGEIGLSSADEENLSDGVLEPELLSRPVQSSRQSPPSCRRTYDQRSRGVGEGAECSGLSSAQFLPSPARRSRPSKQLGKPSRETPPSTSYRKRWIQCQFLSPRKAGKPLRVETCEVHRAKKPKIVGKKHGTAVDVSSDNEREQLM